MAANSAGWGGDREDGGGEECGLGTGSDRSVAPPVTVLVSCAFRVRFACVLRAFCVRARHACMFGVRVRR